MLVCDLTLPSPEENLACDEALLDECEAGSFDAVLRFWEPETSFVVVGYSNEVSVEVNESACKQRGIPIFRRCTGGGTVLQGPGCLNYSLVIPIHSHPALGRITGTNTFVMEKNRAAVEKLLGTQVELAGHTDLVIAGRKFCGNAQRRRRKCLIFHGCFLFGSNIPLMEEVLRMPSKQPDYRSHRRHLDFVMNLEATPSGLKKALMEEWDANTALVEVPAKRIGKLVRDKYSLPEWNLKTGFLSRQMTFPADHRDV